MLLLVFAVEHSRLQCLYPALSRSNSAGPPDARPGIIRPMKWLEYFAAPRHAGALVDCDAVGRAGGGCGDLVEIRIKLAGEKISGAAFLATGCPAAIAGAEALTGMLIGAPLEAAAGLGVREIVGVLEDVPAERHRCLYLSETALAAALEDLVSRGALRLRSKGRAAVAMSGGVDSSTAAFALLDNGWHVVGVTQRLHDFGRPGVKSCCTPEDIDDAREIAHLGGFPHFTVDMRERFAHEVIDNFCASYISGRTPNPCVECNRRVRFTGLLDTATHLGAEKLATGHYVRILRASGSANEQGGGPFQVRRAADPDKDQSYMFWSATQDVLSRLLAPLGELTKAEVRDLAGARGLPVAAKGDSQDVCFVPDGDYAAFVRTRTGYEPMPGRIVDSAGRDLGCHRGLVHYTVGQRKGLGVSSSEPLYVTRLNMDLNELVVGSRDALRVTRFTVSQVNFVDGQTPGGAIKTDIMSRYNGPLSPGTVHPLGDGAALVEFTVPDGPIAPGQSAVFYDGDRVIGGGIID